MAESPMGPNTQRIRDPIHDLIVFDEKDPIDVLAWDLLETAEFQRLRRIKQLGVSEFVFPGATHTRFAHSIGVYHNARRLLGLIEREIHLGRAAGSFDKKRAKTAALAALLHDVGHGPFSHAFEEARRSIAERRSEEKTQAQIKKHEGWTADIIENSSGQIFDVLKKETGLAADVANLLRADTPTDMYHAIVSSSFDADRLDYLERDRYMTGTASAAIDLVWLLDNVRVAEIDVSHASGLEEPALYTHTFCLAFKARDTAEDFLLARYRLFSNVYFHKTTRGFEQLLAAIFRSIAERAESGKLAELGLGEEHPLALFFSPKGETIENYLALDDTVVWGAIERLTHSSDARLADIALRLRTRKHPYSIDIQVQFPDDLERQRRAKHQIENTFRSVLGDTVFKDEMSLTLYGEIGADDAKAQQRLMIMLPNKDLKEITRVGDATIAGSERKRHFLRYYFLNESDRDSALRSIKGGK